MSKVKISHLTKSISGELHLNGSKSISNRVLVIRALCGEDFDLENISSSKDSSTLIKLLKNEDTEQVFDAGHAGTTFRFLTAYFAIKDGKQFLTGSHRMLQRPIGPLVEALNQLGANISYDQNKGYPPLQIETPTGETGGEVSIRGDISSQFLSALLLIGPYMDRGLTLNIDGELVSRPYLMMTINLMRHFGAELSFEDQKIVVKKGGYKAKDFFVEGDWSSASYFYEICALADKAEIIVTGLSQNSLQGDSQVLGYFEQLGVNSEFLDGKLKLTKVPSFEKPEIIEFNLIEEPDLTQTIVCTCSGLGINSVYSGLKTLKIKETDRVAALAEELSKFQVFFTKLPDRFSEKQDDDFYMLSERILPTEEEQEIDTYDDHRMALAFAPLGLIKPITINNPEVVVKPYPEYWEHLKNLGFTLAFSE